MAFLPVQVMAWTFDARNGRLVADEREGIFISLDANRSLPDGVELTLRDTDYQPLDRAALSRQFVADEVGLEGTGALVVGGEVTYGGFDLTGLTAQLGGRRVEVRIWQRPEGTRVAMSLEYGVGDSSSGWRGWHYLGDVVLTPTGRVTDDGWEEWSSWPIDFLAAGEVGPSELSLNDAQLRDMQFNYLQEYNVEASVRLDALAIIDLGPALVPALSCRAVDEAEQCGELGLCLYGRCVDAALVQGPVPGLRADYVERRLFERETFAGGREPLSRMESMRAEVVPILSAGSRWFWSTLDVATQGLGDGHASAPIMVYPQYISVGACLHLGQADLLPGAPQRPLVFATVAGNPLTAQLEVGDALVAIDGLPPGEWARLAGRRFLNYPGDERGFDVVTAPQLVTAATVAGSTLSFARCSRDAGAMAPCGESEVVRFDIDLGALFGASLWQGSPPDWRYDRISCDFRFQRALESEHVSDSDFAGYVDEDEIRTLLINAVPSSQTREGAHWFQVVKEALNPPPEKLIFDQRLGHGGTIEAVDLLATLLLADEDLHGADLFPSLDRPLDEVRDSLLGCHDESFSGMSCGGYFRWTIGLFNDEGLARGLASATKVAVLNGSDVSGNDFTSRFLASRGNTRIFGPAPTWGAFGVIWSLPRHLGEYLGGSFQVHDSTFLRSADDTAVLFETTHGVEPDEIVVQKQSDALLGIDTAVEAAKAWLREGTP